MVATRTIRNRFVGAEPARGFESHLLRHKAKPGRSSRSGLAFLFYYSARGASSAFNNCRNLYKFTSIH